MQKGFSHEVAPVLIRETPGESPEYYAGIALNRGLASSDSKSPLQSLASTLRKELREGRLPEFRTMKRGGRIRVYPATAAVDSESESRKSPRQPATVPISVTVTRDVHEAAALLVEVGKQATYGESISWMAQQWLNDSVSYLAKVRQAALQMREIRNAI